MTVSRWRNMSKMEKAAYLNAREIAVESKLVFDTPRAVGDVTAVKEVYRSRIGSVILSSWRSCPAEARMAAAGALKSINNEAGYAKAN